MKVQNFKPKFLRVLSDNKGQGSTEYVLVLLISTLFVVGLLLQFHQGFRQFTNQYFGSYLSCLLETGELPSLGYSGPRAPESCEVEYQPFTLAQGRPPVEGSGTAGNVGGGGSGSSEKTSEAASAATGAGSEPRQITASAGAGGGVPGEINSFGLLGDKSGRIKKVPLSKADIDTGSTSSAEFEDLERNGDSGNNQGRESLRSGRVPVSINEESQATSLKKPLLPATIEDAKREARRVPAADQQKKKAQVPEDAEWSISGYFKILLIVGIIVAMLIFFAGQILQISKSRE